MIESKNSEIEKVVNFFQEKEYENSINLANNILLDDPSNLFVQNILALSLKNIGKRKNEIFDIVNVKFRLNIRVGNISKCKNTQ